MTAYCANRTTLSGLTTTVDNYGHMRIWVCERAINWNLAYDVQNNRTDLMARRLNGAWTCY
jgi:hypothetical protein